MHITKLFLKSVLSSALLVASFGILAADHQDHQDHQDHHPSKTAVHHSAPIAVPDLRSHTQQARSLSDQESVGHEKPVGATAEHDHRKEHGAQIYSQVILDQKWQINSAGNGAFKSENEARIGTDENKVFLKLQADKSESSQADYAAEILYSRNISDFWDVQTGLRYRQENISQHTASLQNERFDAVLGLHGLAPYFFETNAYLYVGEDDFVGFKLETERDLLLTQKLIMQPFIELDIIFNDQAASAKKSGLSHATLGLETRYEISKKVMPYLQVGYEYSKGNKQAVWQQASGSDRVWIYALGLKMMF